MVTVTSQLLALNLGNPELYPPLSPNMVPKALEMIASKDLPFTSTP